MEPLTPGDTFPRKDPLEEIEPSGAQVAAAIVIALALAAASRGRISPERGYSVARFGVKTLVGIGAGHFVTKLPGHGPNGPPPATDDDVNAALNLLNESRSPSGRYFYVYGQDGRRTRVPEEFRQDLIDQGLIRVTRVPAGPRVGRVAGGIQMSPLWNADP